MTGFLSLNHVIDGLSDGDRITVEPSYNGRNARVTVEEVVEDEDSRETETVSVILSPLQLRALAALCLIQAEELDRTNAPKTEPKADPDPPEFEVYSEGLVSASVCSSLPFEEVARRMSERGTGISCQWAPSDEPTFQYGQPNPCPCDANPATHTHYLFNC